MLSTDINTGMERKGEGREEEEGGRRMHACKERKEEKDGRRGSKRQGRGFIKT